VSAADRGAPTSASATAGPIDVESGSGLSLRCWGTRGSIPSPGPQTARYGGNTSCVEVVAGDRHLIFDAGSGARALGMSLQGRQRRVDTTLFLTHFHWDHIQGIPFFSPLYDPATRLDIVGPVQRDPAGRVLDVESLFAGQMGPIYFPIPMSAVSAGLTFGHLNEGEWEQDGVRVRAMRVKHPSFTVGYRVDYEGGSLAYVPDNELAADSFEVGPDWRDRFVEFLGDVDVLLHDAMYTTQEYPSRTRWGHSTYDQVVDLADEVGARELVFFHHDPMRSDDELDEIVARSRDAALSAGRSVNIRAAAEGENIPS